MDLQRRDQAVFWPSWLVLGELAAQQLPVGWQAAGGLCSEEVPGEPGFSGHPPATSTPAAAQLWIPKQ